MYQLLSKFQAQSIRQNLYKKYMDINLSKIIRNIYPIFIKKF